MMKFDLKAIEAEVRDVYSSLSVFHIPESPVKYRAKIAALLDKLEGLLTVLSVASVMSRGDTKTALSALFYWVGGIYRYLQSLMKKEVLEDMELATIKAIEMDIKLLEDYLSYEKAKERAGMTEEDVWELLSKLPVQLKDKVMEALLSSLFDEEANE